MTKDEIKLLCEADAKLQWWAMVLFAEIMAAHDAGYARDDQALALLVRAKATEFPQLIVQRQIERAKEEVQNDRP